MDGLGDDEADALLNPESPEVVAERRVVDAQPDAGKTMSTQTTSYGATDDGAAAAS